MRQFDLPTALERLSVDCLGIDPSVMGHLNFLGTDHADQDQYQLYLASGYPPDCLNYDSRVAVTVSGDREGFSVMKIDFNMQKLALRC